MRSIRKLAAAVFAAAFFAAVPAAVNAYAAEAINYTVDYDYYGSAFLETSPAVEGDILTYTTDGSAPEAGSPKLQSSLEVKKKTSFRVAEFTPEGKKLGGLRITVTPRVAPVLLESEEGDGSTLITLTCYTENANIYYTTDGSSPSEASTLYTEPFSITRDTKIKAAAFKDDMKKSVVLSRKIAVEEKTVLPSDLPKTRSSTTFEAEKGRAYVSLYPQRNSNKIYYTTDGSAPNKKSKLYSKRIKFTEIGVLRAVEYSSKGEAVSSIRLNVALKCAPVEFICTDISVGTKLIEMVSATSDAKIYYTINGTIPDPATAQLYTGPVTLGDLTNLSAVAVKDGYKKSSLKNTVVRDVPYRIRKLDYSNPLYKDTADIINEKRKKNGLNELRLDNQLIEVANIRAKELITYNDHYRPSGTYYTSVFSECGVVVDMNAEFIATFHKTPQALVDYLLQQPENKLLISKGYNYTSIGVGYCEYGNSRYWCIIIAEK